MKVRFRKLGKIDDSCYQTNIYGAEHNNIIWAKVYQGTDFQYRNKQWSWKWVVKYTPFDNLNKNWVYEHFDKFKDARKRAIEIAIEKCK